MASLFRKFEKHVLRPIGKNAAPIIGSAIGMYLGGPTGAVIGGSLGGSTQRGGANKFAGALKGAGIGATYAAVAPMMGEFAGASPTSPGFWSSVTGLNKPSLLYQLGMDSAPGIGGGLGLYGNAGTSGYLESLSPFASKVLGFGSNLANKLGDAKASHGQQYDMQELLRQQQENLANEAAFSHGTGLSQRSPGGPLHSMQDVASDVSYSMPAPDLHTAALLAQLRPRKKSKSLHESLTEESTRNTNPLQKYVGRGGNPLKSFSPNGPRFASGGLVEGVMHPNPRKAFRQMAEEVIRLKKLEEEEERLREIEHKMHLSQHQQNVLKDFHEAPHESGHHTPRHEHIAAGFQHYSPRFGSSGEDNYAQGGYADGGFLKSAYNKLKPYAPYVGGALGAAALGGLGAYGQSLHNQDQDRANRVDNFFEEVNSAARNSRNPNLGSGVGSLPNAPFNSNIGIGHAPMSEVGQLSRIPMNIPESMSHFSTMVPPINVSRIQNPNYGIGEIGRSGDELFGRIPLGESVKHNNLEKYGLVKDDPFNTPFFKKSYAKGGYANPNHHGYIKEGDTGGQDDDVDMVIPQGSYVMNATDVSLLGDGSSENGAKKLSHLESRLSRRLGGRIHPQEISRGAMKVKVSNDEYVLHPTTVSALGKGDNRKGAEVLDKMRKNLRIQKGVKKILPPKSKEIVAYIPKARRHAASS